MTEIDPSRIIKDGDNIYFRGKKYKKVEEPETFYNKLWELVSDKIGDNTNADELTDRIMDLIQDNILEEKSNPPEPTRNKYFLKILNAPIDERGYIDLREPTSEFRQKLFDGIKSVFYDPEYERTHWSVKVNMAVDEVLTHFEDILPASQDLNCEETDSISLYSIGWNWCLSAIRRNMEKM